MASESITTRYGDRFTVATQEASQHVLLHVRFDSEAEPFAYGFTPADFRSFVKACLRLDEQITAGTGQGIDQAANKIAQLEAEQAELRDELHALANRIESLTRLVQNRTDAPA